MRRRSAATFIIHCQGILRAGRKQRKHVRHRHRPSTPQLGIRDLEQRRVRQILLLLRPCLQRPRSPAEMVVQWQQGLHDRRFQLHHHYARPQRQGRRQQLHQAGIGLRHHQIRSRQRIFRRILPYDRDLGRRYPAWTAVRAASACAAAVAQVQQRNHHTEDLVRQA